MTSPLNDQRNTVYIYDYPSVIIIIIIIIILVVIIIIIITTSNQQSHLGTASLSFSSHISFQVAIGSDFKVL